ncbi:uncharacterized protein LOC110931499 [Helianthus annuus]|uniref:uncharacterized protein LOC110931499 n=1 Tax=Helianthus annuus TaxID=4232 RepID=UPI000B8F4465|nr:uncharacterized protein LOC110931499 [Helianthus annuus]
MVSSHHHLSLLKGWVEDVSDEEVDDGQTGQNKSSSKIDKSTPVVTIPIPKVKEKGVDVNVAPYPEALLGPSMKVQTHKFAKKLDLTEKVRSIFSGELPPKLQDPGVPIISIQVGEFEMTRVPLDLGASVSILPGSLYDQYKFGPLQPANTTVVLADLTPKIPRGIVTDVIVKVEDFYYPVDFLVLDYVSLDRTKQPTVILGRQFLATSNAQMNCKSGTVDMTFGNCRLRLNIFSGLTNPLVKDECYMADIVDECIPLCDTGVDEENTIEECFMFDRLQMETNRSIDEEEKKLEILAPPTVELKVLPKHLKYAYVGEGNTLTVIIASNLTGEQEEKLMAVLITNRVAIGYLIEKKDAKPQLIRWVILLPEFDLEIRDTKGSENVVVDHLSHLMVEEGSS